MSLYYAVMYCTKGVRGQKVPRVSDVKRFLGCQSLKGAKGIRGQKVPRVPGSKAKKVYSGAGFSQELISDRA